MKRLLGMSMLALGLVAGCGNDLRAGDVQHRESYATADLYGWGMRYARFAANQAAPNEDVALLIKVKSALLGTPDLQRFALEVGVLNRVVTLYGEVDTAERRATAERVARSVHGVEAVKSGIAITAPV